MITNATPASAAAQDIRDIKPPIEISDGHAWLWYSLNILALLVAAFLIWRWWKNKKTNIVLPPPVPAHIRAKTRLEQALALITQPKPFVIAVSDTARAYLEERFNFRAPERTTEEFLRELAGTKLLLPEQKESLGGFLASCDLVKFAKYEPGENELRELHTSAVRLVDETMPAQTPADSVQNSETRETPPILQPTQKSKKSLGKILAIFGTILQLAPFIWVVAYLVTSFRLFILADSPTPIDVKHPFDAYNAMMGKMNSIVGEGLLIFLFGLFVGLVGLVFLIVALTVSRYRAEWFFWFLLIYGLILCVGFPFTTAFGIFFLVYCLTKRREFLNRS
jgi:hypothetical protein